MAGDITDTRSVLSSDEVESLATLVSSSFGTGPYGNFLARLVRNAPRNIPKAADQTVNNSAVLASDTHIAFRASANDVYFFELLLDVVGASTAADLQISWSLPSGATKKWTTQALSPDVLVAATPVALSTGTLTFGLGALENLIRVSGWITVSTNPGTCTFQWAQNTQTAEDTILKKGSFLSLQKLT